VIAGETLELGPEFYSRGEDELQLQYLSYRRRQARALVRMLPRDAVRPLYRRALGADADGTRADPIEALVSYCETLLPLPPFQVWAEDLARDPKAHLRDLEDSAEAPTPVAPATLEVRALQIDGHVWLARLRSYRDGDAWRGFIAFEDTRSRVVHRTALIFREIDPTDVRDRFLSFDPSALAAFLRSALP
jgi:hypothetical protein